MDESKAFKNQVSESLVKRLATATRSAWPPFDQEAFVRAVVPALPALELKARIARVTAEWAARLPADFAVALPIALGTMGPPLESDTGVSSGLFYHWIHAHFVETRGLSHLELALDAMVEITQRGTAEFCVRPYLQRHPKQVLAFLTKQRTHASPHVRRWVSEGTRPRLPWGLRLSAFVLDPAPVLKLIAPLRKDPSLYVRNSVANNLNDIAKDHPDLVVNTVTAWMAENDNPHAAWIGKRALRHLIKQGHAGALAALGFGNGTRACLVDFALDRTSLKVGDSLTMQITLKGGANERINLDYAIGYPLAAGQKRTTGNKVYKLKAFDLAKGQTLALAKTHSFRPITTRTYYGGRHTLTLLANGKALATAEFVLRLPTRS